MDLPDLQSYASRLAADPAKRAHFKALCHIPISRFYRDRLVFEVLCQRLLPKLVFEAARNRRSPRCWCLGCASGEEPYSLAIIWREAIEPADPGAAFDLPPTDAKPSCSRAAQACYEANSLKELPPAWRARVFVLDNASFCLRAYYKRIVTSRRRTFVGTALLEESILARTASGNYPSTP